MPVIVTGPAPADIVVTTPITQTITVPLVSPAAVTVGVVQGLPGESSPAFETQFPTALATWTLAVPSTFGRTPNVAVFVGGQAVIAEVHASDSLVSVIFPEPMTGSVVLN